MERGMRGTLGSAGWAVREAGTVMLRDLAWVLAGVGWSDKLACG